MDYTGTPPQYIGEKVTNTFQSPNCYTLENIQHIFIRKWNLRFFIQQVHTTTLISEEPPVVCNKLYVHVYPSPFYSYLIKVKDRINEDFKSYLTGNGDRF